MNRDRTREQIQAQSEQGLNEREKQSPQMQKQMELLGLQEGLAIGARSGKVQKQIRICRSAGQLDARSGRAKKQKQMQKHRVC